jgi:hypothetical protein
MKLRIGDKVRFLNEKGEGVVTRFGNKETAFVEMPDGFEIPYSVKQLVPIHTELIINSEAENLDLEPESGVTDALYFVIEPDHELPMLVSDYNIYLFNSSSYNLIFTYSIKDEAYFQTLKHGEVGAYQKLLLKTVKSGFFKEYPYHKIECLLFKSVHYRGQIPVSETVFVNPSIFNHHSLIKHEEFKRPVFAFMLKDEFIVLQNVEQELSKEDIERLKKMKESNSFQKTSRSHKEQLKNQEKEIDLHIEELVEDVNGLTSHEMLSIQLERFEKELDKAMETGVKKLVFIHGVGNGRLKMEIRNALKATSGVTFQDASYKLYGFGATQVNIL